LPDQLVTALPSPKDNGRPEHHLIDLFESNVVPSNMLFAAGLADKLIDPHVASSSRGHFTTTTATAPIGRSTFGPMHRGPASGGHPNRLRSAGRHDYEIFEDALRRYAATSPNEASRQALRNLLSQLGGQSDLSEEAAPDLAYSELHASRRARRRG